MSTQTVAAAAHAVDLDSSFITDSQHTALSQVRALLADSCSANSLTSLEPDETASGTINPTIPDTPDTLQLAASFRHSGWKRQREQVLSALNRTGQAASRVGRFCSCGSNAWVLRCTTNPKVFRLACDRCRDRFCTPCATEKRGTVCANLRRQLPPGQLRMLTLTLRSRPDPLATQLDRLHSCFQRLRAQPSFRKRLAGGLTFLELTINEETGLWHPHLHVLCQGTFIPIDEVRHTWQNITGDSFVVHLKLLHNPEAAARYVAKYASKALSKEAFDSQPHLDEAVVALAGRRTFNAFGTWRKLSLARPPADDLNWEPVAPLATLIARAESGDHEARVILAYLRREDADEPSDRDRVHAAPAPVPDLFDASS